MSNWDGALETGATTGKLPSMFPADVPIPMVAPDDLGKVAADRLLSPRDDVGVRYIEGPRRYSSKDVAKAFSAVIGKPVELSITPRDQWKGMFLQLGFSDAAANSYARMTAVSLDGGFDLTDDPIRGTTTLEMYVRERARKRSYDAPE